MTPAPPIASATPRPALAANEEPLPAPSLKLRSLAEACEAELKLNPSAARAARLHFEIGEVMDDPAKALQQYQAALQKSADHLPAIHGARRQLLSKGKVKAAAKLFDAEAATADDPSKKAQLLWAKGCALLDIGGDSDGAQKAFAQAAELDTNNTTLLKSHRHVQLQAKQWTRLAETLQHEAAACADDNVYRAALLVAQAQLIERRLRDPEQATEQLATALQLHEATPLALPEQKRLLFSQGRWGALIELVKQEISLTEQQDIQTLGWWTISRLHSERLQNPQEAADALEQAVEISPNDVMLLEELARLYEQLANISGCSSALERLAKATAEGPERVGVYHRLGELHHQNKDPKEAAHWYEAAVTADAGFRPALTALDALYQQMSNWPALAAIYVAEANADLSSTQRAAAHTRAAAIFDSKLDSAAKATSHYTKALALDPQQEQAFKALVKLHTIAGRYDMLIELYDRAVERAISDDIAIAYLFKMGTIYEDVLVDVRNAMQVYQRILTRQPKNIGAIHALQRTAERSEQYHELVEALDREAKLESDRVRKLELEHHAAATLADKLGDHEAALPRLKSIVKADTQHASALATLARVERALGRSAPLLEIYEQQLAIAEGTAPKVALLLEMARLAERAIDDDAKAIGSYRRAVELQPDNALARAGLTRLLRKQGDHRTLTSVLNDELQAATKPAQAARAALLLGEVQEVHLKAPQKAVAAYQSALDAHPGHRPALDALARVHAAEGAWKELTETLLAEAEASSDVRLAQESRLRAAHLLAERLNNVEEALALVEELADQDPGNVSALLLLEQLYVGKDDKLGQTGLFARQARVIQAAGAKVAALTAQGRLLAGEEHREDRQRICLSILAIDRANPFALETLRAIATSQKDQVLAAKVHARVSEIASDRSLQAAELIRCGDALCDSDPASALGAYRQALALVPDSLRAIRGLAAAGSRIGDAGTMVESYQGEARWTKDAVVAADLFVQSAAVLARLSDSDGAIEACSVALAQCPDHKPAAEMLTALMKRAERIEALIGQLSQAAHTAEQAPRKAALWQQVADLQANQQNDLGAAVIAMKRTLDAQPKDTELLLKLAELYDRNTQYDEAAEVYNKAVALDDNQLDAHLALGRIYSKHRVDVAKAQTSLERVLRDDSDNREALALKLQLHLDAGERDLAHDTSEQLLDAAGDDTVMRAWALVEIGKLELKSRDEERAAESLLAAVTLEGVNGASAKLYKRMLAGQTETNSAAWEQYIRALRDYLTSAVVPVATLPPIYLEIAHIQHQRLNQPSDAFLALQEGLTRCQGNPQLRLARAQMLVATARVADAQSAYQKLACDQPDLAEAWRGYATLLQEQGLQRRASWAAAPLVVLGASSEVERNLAKAIPKTATPQGSMGRATLRILSAASDESDERVATLFTALADGIGKAYPLSYDKYDVRKGDRIKPRTGHPLRNQLDTLAQAFAVDDVELYVHDQQGGDVVVELTQPPTLMVPAHIAELPDLQRTFLLSRGLAAIAAGTHPAFALPTSETSVLIAAAITRLVPTFDEGKHDRERLLLLQEKLTPSWFSRGKVDEAIQRYYPEAVNIAAWAPTVIQSATRAAALVCGDLEACVEALRLVSAIPTNITGERLLAQPLVDDLLRFWMSNTAMKARKQAGLL